MRIYNMKFFCCALLFIMFSGFSALALPGDNYSEIKNWSIKQKFFPQNTSKSSQDGVTFFKNLTNNRVLLYKIVWNDQQVIEEEIIIFNTIDVLKISECKEQVSVGNYLFSSSSYSIDAESCIENSEINFLDTKSQKIKNLFENIYNNKSKMLLNDLIYSNDIKSGTWYFKYNLSGDVDFREKLTKNINISIRQGKLYTYFINSYGIKIVLNSYFNEMKKMSSYKNYFKEWEDDNKLKKNIEEKEKQDILDKELSKPYDL